MGATDRRHRRIGGAWLAVVALGGVAAHRLTSAHPRVQLGLLATSLALVVHYQALHGAWFGA